MPNLTYEQTLRALGTKAGRTCTIWSPKAVSWASGAGKKAGRIQLSLVFPLGLWSVKMESIKKRPLFSKEFRCLDIRFYVKSKHAVVVHDSQSHSECIWTGYKLLSLSRPIFPIDPNPCHGIALENYPIFYPCPAVRVIDDLSSRFDWVFYFSITRVNQGVAMMDCHAIQYRHYFGDTTSWSYHLISERIILQNNGFHFLAKVTNLRARGFAIAKRFVQLRTCAIEMHLLFLVCGFKQTDPGSKWDAWTHRVIFLPVIVDQSTESPYQFFSQNSHCLVSCYPSEIFRAPVVEQPQAYDQARCR